MDITEVRIKLMEDAQERLQAFCSITFDHCFVIRDLKIIEGTRGSFVAMPSRKLTDRCPKCSTKNHLRAGYCNQCGVRLREDRGESDGEGRVRLYADIAHPINARCREHIQAKVMKAFAEEQHKASLPGYVCTYDDYGEDAYADLHDREQPSPAGESDTVSEIPQPTVPESPEVKNQEITHHEFAGQQLRIEPATDRVSGVPAPHFHAAHAESRNNREAMTFASGRQDRQVPFISRQDDAECDGFGAGLD